MKSGHGITRGPAISLPSRERILLYGKEGTGKTHAWFSVAEALPDVPFFCVDTDDSVQRLLETDFQDLTNIECRVAQTWEEFDQAVKDFTAKIDAWTKSHPPKKKQDYPWIIVDMSDVTWDMVQSYFTEKVFNKGIEDYFLQTRVQMAKSHTTKDNQFEGWTDWPVINKIFQSTWNKLAKGGDNYHLYITAGAKPPTGAENKSMYGPLKAMPTGEKRMGHRVHTILMGSVTKNGWALSTAKDRGRAMLDEQKVMSFYVSYLIKTAGWVPE